MKENRKPKTITLAIQTFREPLSLTPVFGFIITQWFRRHV